MLYKRRVVVEMGALECRRLLAATYPTAYEQYLVELVNRARANPSAEAARFGIDLNEGLSAGTISTAVKQPLAINPYLTTSSHSHSQWMIDNQTFSHTGVNGTDPGQRMTNAGYVFSGSWTWGENIGWSGTTGSLDVTATTAEVDQDLFVDSGVSGRGHRTNMMSPAFREIGAGVVTGTFTGYNAVMATEDFGTTGTTIYLTGVAYSDTVVKDNFYTPGEGLAGVTITATRTSDNAKFTTITWTSGGYSLALPVGTYNVTGSGGGLGGTVAYPNVVISTQNVKEDFRPDQVSAGSFATVTGGVLTVQGTSSADNIAITLSGNQYTITRNSTSTTISSSGITSIQILAGDGDDVVTVGPAIMGVYVDAGMGNDKVTGGDGNDTITGGAQKDTIYGGNGDDRLNGDGGNDQLYGQAGKDRLYGGDASDTLDGGSSTDRLWGGPGNNVYYGEGQNDYIYARSDSIDTIFGGTGTDSAQVDSDDVVSTVEIMIP